MNCLRCGATVDLSRQTCPACGTAIDADGNGVPDVIDRMVEKKVNDMLGSGGGRTGEPSRPALGRAPTEARREDRSDPHRELELCQQRLSRNLKQPRPRWVLDVPRFLLVVALAVGIGGVLFTQLVEGIILDRSLVAATIFCPGHCPSCSGPGRIFSWHERSTNHEGSVSIQLCTSPAIDVNRLSKLDVLQRQDLDLLPYRLSLWTNFLCNSVLGFAVFMLVVPLLFAWLRRRELRLDRLWLELTISKLKARIDETSGAGWLPR